MKMNGSKADYVEWAKVIAADKDKKSKAYLEFYHFLLHCFTEADSNLDGEIDVQEFDASVQHTLYFAHKHGLETKCADLYKTPEEQLAARKKLFQEIDTNKDGSISFNEFLAFFLKHICELTKKM
eukprot:342708_1